MLFNKVALAINEIKIEEKNELLAIVHGKEITKTDAEKMPDEYFQGLTPSTPENIDDEYRYQVLSFKLYQEIFKQLDKKCQINVTEQEVASYQVHLNEAKKKRDLEERNLKATIEQPPLSAQEQRQVDAKVEQFAKDFATQQWTTFYRYKCLYETYGGQVIFQQFAPLEPVGAMRSYLEKLEQEGKLKILHQPFNEKFWHYYKRAYHVEVPAEHIDFSRPWWEKTQE